MRVTAVAVMALAIVVPTVSFSVVLLPAVVVGLAYSWIEYVRAAAAKYLR